MRLLPGRALRGSGASTAGRLRAPSVAVRGPLSFAAPAAECAAPMAHPGFRALSWPRALAPIGEGGSLGVSGLGFCRLSSLATRAQLL